MPERRAKTDPKQDSDFVYRVESGMNKNVTLEDDVHMKVPEGTEHNKITRKIKDCKLKRAFYGLKVSPKSWNGRIT